MLDGSTRPCAARSRRYGMSMRRLLIAPAVALCLASASCASDAHQYSSVVAMNVPVLLVPDVHAGRVGWCMVKPGGGVCPEGPASGPTVAEAWSTGGPPWFAAGYALTTASVSAVSVEGGHAIMTRHESALPDGLRAVAVELRGWRYKPGTPRSVTHLWFTPLNARGQALPESRSVGSPLSVLTTTHLLSDPEHPGSAACAIEIGATLVGLAATEGSVVTSITPYSARFGNPYLSCASTRFKLENGSLLAGVLVDAAHPGATPAPLPQMRRLPGHDGVFEAPAFEGQMLARRIAGAWLVVQGEGVQQQLAVLEHIQAIVHA